MKRLLVVSHRPLEQEGGSTARWKAFVRYLPEHGWEVEVVSAPARTSGVEFAADERAARRVAARARVMAQVGRAAAPIAALAGVRPEAMPPSMAWAARGAREVRSQVESWKPDVVLATAPPMVAAIAARRSLRGDGPPLVVEMRDLWAGSPAFDNGGRLLTRVEHWAFEPSAAIVVMAPEAADDLGARHPGLRERIAVIPNGFDPALSDVAPAARSDRDRIELIHSGIVNAGRPPMPLVDALGREPYRSRFRLTFHGYLTPDVAAQLAAADAPLELVPASSWEDAIARIAAADAGVVLQGDAVGDSTAVASKVFEYMALAKPVLAITDGGATESLLRRLGADQLTARLADPASIAAALDRLMDDPPAPPPQDAISRYDRRRLAGEMAALLDRVAAR